MLTVTLETARRVIEGVEAKAWSIGCPVNIAVVDAGGNLVAHVRMDNARIGATEIAINKAWTARAFDMETASPVARSSASTPPTAAALCSLQAACRCATPARSSAPSASVADPMNRTPHAREPAPRC
jgi:uncharacterized protein GlcG (DUF336 family)